MKNKTKNKTIKEVCAEISIIRNQIECIEENLVKRVADRVNKDVHTFAVIYEQLLEIKSLYFSGSISNEKLNDSILQKYAELLQRNNELFDEIMQLKKIIK